MTGDRVRVEVNVNGETLVGLAEPRMHLGDFLRQELRLTGTHLGCEHGACGACTVLFEGRPVRACLMLAVQAAGAHVKTVESLAMPGGPLNDLQAAFRKHHALQCGFCTPGILMTLTALLDANPEAGEAEVQEALSGHLCRCTGYAPIVAATLWTLQQRRAKGAA